MSDLKPIITKSITSILKSFKKSLYDIFYKKSEIDEKLKNIDTTDLMKKTEFVSDINTNSVKKADNLSSEYYAESETMYSKDINGNIGWHPYSVSITKNNFTSIINNVIENKTYTISLKEKDVDCALLIQPEEYIPGEVTEKTMSLFNDENEFYCNKEHLIFSSDGVRIKNNYQINSIKNNDIYESKEIDLSNMVDLIGIEEV